MVSEDEKTAYKKVLGHRYSRKVVMYLNKKGLKNSNDKTYSQAHVRNVMNGDAPHSIIEDAILEVYKIELGKIEDKKKILSEK